MRISLLFGSLFRDVFQSISPWMQFPGGRFAPRRRSGFRSPLQHLECRKLLSGTAVQVKDINPGVPDSSPNRGANVNGTFYFSASENTHGFELWKSDGTTAGTVLVKDILPGIKSSGPSGLTNVNGTLFFTASDGTNGFELWKSNGTAAGTVLVKDIDATGSSSPDQLTNVNGVLFFKAYDDVNGMELWKSDGTTAGTVIVRDIRPGSALGSYPGSLTNVNGTLFFTANDGTTGMELWKSDGTSAGTVQVQDIHPGALTSSLKYLTAVNGTLFFQAYGTVDVGAELWKSDGTSAGTVVVKDILPGSSGSGPSSLTNVNGSLFFSATDDSYGSELWVSDGTELGTSRVTDINPGGAGSNPSSLTNINGTLYFRAEEPFYGGELWKSDGTFAGTQIVADVNPGETGTTFGYLTNVNGTLYFRADGVNGYELWQSDGSSFGTVLVQDLNPGADGSFPRNLVNVNGTLFFTAANGTNGMELWGLFNPPTLAGGNLLNYALNQPATPINPNIIVTDPARPRLASASVKITNAWTVDDVLAFVNNDAAKFGNITGSYAPATGLLSLVSSGGTATVAQFQAALRAVTYFNKRGANANVAPRNVTYQVSDGSLNSNIISCKIGIGSPPLLGGAGTLAYAKNQPATAITPGLTLVDADHPRLAFATVKLTNYFSRDDVLGFVANPATMGNITGGFSTTTGLLTLTSKGATATVAQFQAALRAVTYFNRSGANANVAPRYAAYQISDGTLASNILTSTIGFGSPPVLGGAGFLSYTKGQPATAISPALTVSDADQTAPAGATVKLTNFYSRDDVLGFVNDNATLFGNITGGFSTTTGILTLTSVGRTATVAQFQAALRAVTYFNRSGANANAAPRYAAYQVSDGIFTSNIVTSTIAIS